MPTASRSTRGGFTLVELMISLVLLGIVGAVMASMLVNMQRGSRAQSQRVTLQSNLRAGMALLPAELRELSPPDLVTLWIPVGLLVSLAILFLGQWTFRRLEGRFAQEL